MHWMLTAIIAIVVYQILIVLVYSFTNENEDVMEWMAMFFPIITLKVTYNCIKFFRLRWSRKHLNVYRFGWNDEEGNHHTSQTFYATSQAMKNFTFDTSKTRYIAFVSTGHRFKSLPHKNEIFKGQNNFMGFNMKLYESEESFDDILVDTNV